MEPPCAKGMEKKLTQQYEDKKSNGDQGKGNRIAEILPEWLFHANGHVFGCNRLIRMAGCLRAPGVGVIQLGMEMHSLRNGGA